MTPPRTVRFYVPTVAGHSSNGRDFSAGFWPAVFEHLQGLPEESREFDFNSSRIYGQVRRCDYPEIRYLYVGRVRSRDHFPDRFRHGEGSTGRLEPGKPGDEMAEPTYMVPFGEANAVAVLAPVSAPIRAGGLTKWLNRSLSTRAPIGYIELEPLLSPSLEEDLSRAVGATRTKVKLSPGVDVPASLGQVGAGMELARAAVGNDAFVEIGFSFGVRGAGSDSGRSRILDLARSVLGLPMGDVASASVSLEVPRAGGGVRVVNHNLVEDVASEDIHIEPAADALDVDRQVVRAALAAAEKYLERQSRPH